MDATEYVYGFVRRGELDIRNDGTVWRVKSKRRIELPRQLTGRDQDGYILITVREGETTRTAKAHRLVYRHRHGPLTPGLQINHKNGVKHDNRIENLELVTNAENIQHGYDKLGVCAAHGESHAHAKLRDEDVVRIRERIAGGESYKSIASAYGVCAQTICNIKRGRSWGHIPTPKQVLYAYAGVSSRKVRGASHPNAKLVPADVIQIRRRLALGHTHRAIARDYRVSTQAVHCIKMGKTWGHV
jgi:hypothetical protein